MKQNRPSRILSFVMKNRLYFLIALAAIAIGLVRPALAQTPVVVELFTSEGCSSCPPADAFLMDLDHKGAAGSITLILLGEHVDYWNYIGWTDRFSSAKFSQRQSEYARQLHSSVYTPQLVVDGSLQSVGSDTSAVYHNIEVAAKERKPAQVTLQWASPNHLHVAEQGAAAGLHVLLAVTEDGLNTSVGSGENGGQTLHHADVVRQLQEIGTTSNGHFDTTVDVTARQGWNVTQLKVAVLVQDPVSGHIVGAASTPFAP
jgi:hypothetical protein